MTNARQLIPKLLLSAATTAPLTANQRCPTVVGTLTINGLIVDSNLVVIGTSTFSNNATINSNLVVLGTTTNTGLSTLNSTQVNSNLNVVGISTFSNSATVNSNLNVVGTSTFNATQVNSTLGVVGVSTFNNNATINSNLVVLGLPLKELYVFPCFLANCMEASIARARARAFQFSRQNNAQTSRC